MKNNGYVVYLTGQYFATLAAAAKSAKELSKSKPYVATVVSCSTEKTLRAYNYGRKTV